MKKARQAIKSAKARLELAEHICTSDVVDTGSTLNPLQDIRLMSRLEFAESKPGGLRCFDLTGAGISTCLSSLASRERRVAGATPSSCFRESATGRASEQHDPPPDKVAAHLSLGSAAAYKRDRQPRKLHSVDLVQATDLFLRHLTQIFWDEWKQAFGFDSAEEEWLARAITCQRACWISSTTANYAKCTAAAEATGCLLYAGNSPDPQIAPTKEQGVLFEVNHGSPMGTPVSWPILDLVSQLEASVAELGEQYWDEPSTEKKPKTAHVSLAATNGDDTLGVWTNLERSRFDQVMKDLKLEVNDTKTHVRPGGAFCEEDFALASEYGGAVTADATVPYSPALFAKDARGPVPYRSSDRRISINKSRNLLIETISINRSCF